MFLTLAQASIKDSKEQFENFLKHTEKGIEFSEKYSNFVKQRAEYEIEHAKNLRKLVKAFQPKKKGKTLIDEIRTLIRNPEWLKVPRGESMALGPAGGWVLAG